MVVLFDKLRTDELERANTDIDTDVGITKTEKYRIPTKNAENTELSVFPTAVSLFSR